MRTTPNDERKHAVADKITVARGSKDAPIGVYETTVIKLDSGNQREPTLDRYARTKALDGKKNVVEIHQTQLGFGTNTINSRLTRQLPIKGLHHTFISFNTSRTFGGEYVYGKPETQRKSTNLCGADSVQVSFADKLTDDDYGVKMPVELKAAELQSGETVVAEYTRQDPYNDIFMPMTSDQPPKPKNWADVSDVALEGTILGNSYTGHKDYDKGLRVKYRGREDFAFNKDAFFGVAQSIHVPVNKEDTSRMPIPTVSALVGI